MKNRPLTIKKRAEFLQVSRNGARAKTSSMVVICAKFDLCYDSKVGYTATRKIGNAVVRNRSKRRLRALVLKFSELFSPGEFFVFIGTENTGSIDYLKLESDFLYCVKKARERANDRP